MFSAIPASLVHVFVHLFTGATAAEGLTSPIPLHPLCHLSSLHLARRLSSIASLAHIFPSLLLSAQQPLSLPALVKHNKKQQSS